MSMSDESDISTDLSSAPESSTGEASSPGSVRDAASAESSNNSVAPEPPVWDRFKTLPEFQGQDDKAIAQRLFSAMQREQVLSRQMQQYHQILPKAQEYISNEREFLAWKNRPEAAPTSAPAAQAPEPAKSWWAPPEVREGFKRFLIKDELGRDSISPEAPLDAQHSLYEFLKYKSDFAQKFLSDPTAALGPMVQEMAQKQAKEMLDARFSEQETHQFIAKVEEENRDWLFDPATGHASNAGLLVHKYIEQAREQGINGAKARWDHAVAMTERHLLAESWDQAQQHQQQQVQQSIQLLEQQAVATPPAAPVPVRPPEQALAEQNMQYLRREAQRNPSRSAGTTNTDPRAPKQNQSFEQLLMSEAISKGLM